jgi:uncharacterized membrane protein YozB (DUF420 family)
MYSTLLLTHSLFRWLVLISLLYAIYRAYQGKTKGLVFSKTDNSIRHWTATIAHIQFIVGINLYLKSPIVKYFFANVSEGIKHLDTFFFGALHIVLMLIAIIVLTVGSALAKRKSTDAEKFKTMLLWFSFALLIIFIAIPWPFSPLANRPLLRTF